MSRPKKRRVIVRLAARDGTDATALLQAVEDVFRPSDLIIESVEQARASDEAGGAGDGEFGNEMLEAEAKGRIGDRLEKKDRQVRAERKKRGENPGQPRPASPVEIARRRLTVREKLGALYKAGWRVSIRVAKECAEDKLLELYTYISGG